MDLDFPFAGVCIGGPNDGQRLHSQTSSAVYASGGHLMIYQWTLPNIETVGPLPSPGFWRPQQTPARDSLARLIESYEESHRGK